LDGMVRADTTVFPEEEDPVPLDDECDVPDRLIRSGAGGRYVWGFGYAKRYSTGGKCGNIYICIVTLCKILTKFGVAGARRARFCENQL